MTAEVAQLAGPVAAPRSGAVAPASDGRTRHRSTWWGRFLGPRRVVGVSVVGLVVAAALVVPVLTAYDPAAQRLLDALQPPSARHPFGTDEFGRDLLSRVIYGARASLEVGFLAVGLAGVAGTLLGQLAGLRGGRLDGVVMRCMDALFAFPALMLALVINVLLGASLTNAVVAIGVVTLPGFARLARGSTLVEREREFVL